MAESSSTDVLAAVVTLLLIAFLVISVSISIAGLVCGHYFRRKFKQSPKETPSQPVPLYDDVLPSAVNVAYCTSKSTVVE